MSELVDVLDPIAFIREHRTRQAMQGAAWTILGAKIRALPMHHQRYTGFDLDRLRAEVYAAVSR